MAITVGLGSTNEIPYKLVKLALCFVAEPYEYLITMENTIKSNSRARR